MSRVDCTRGLSGSTSEEQSKFYHGGASVSLFNNAEHTNISDSQINAHIHVQGNTGVQILLSENSAMGATYNSLERQQLDAAKCHPNTRVAVITRLIDWLIGEIDFDALILWLYGAAGAGKSVIAHTLAEICEKGGRLLATFFFWKTAGKRNNISRFVATIAYQVARAIPASRSHIEAAVNADPMVFHQSIDDQLAKLIIGPFRRLHSTGFDFKDSPFIIIIDGLDECQGTDVQSRLVRSLVAAFHQCSLPIRILIASRPEVYLQSTFNSSSVQPHLARLALSDEYSPEKDIYRFLKDSFKKIRCEHPLASYIPSRWPSTDVLHELTRKSSGQFIFASTTVKYTGGDPFELPTRRLEVIRRLQPPRGEEDLPYAELNSLYNHVLSNVRDVERVKQVLGVLIIIDPVLHSYSMRRVRSTYKVDSLLFSQPGETKACLSQLASVITCDAIGGISISHASLSDFLLDPSRSHQFYLSRESVLGDGAALGLCHMRQEGLDRTDFTHYCFLTLSCMEAVLCWTPQIQQELSQLSLQTLYGSCELHELTRQFWCISSKIIEMMHNQNLVEQFPQLTYDLPPVCFRAFEKTDPDEDLTLLVYEARYSHILQVEALKPALAFPFEFGSFFFGKETCDIIRRIVALHPQRHRLKFTAYHYATVAQYIMNGGLSSNGSAMLSVITHVLPLACMSGGILKKIFIDRCCQMENFHAKWTLDGQSDHIIQPARDAVLDYYKYYAKPSEVDEYMRINDLS